MQRGHPPIFTQWGGDAGLKRLKDEVLPLFLCLADGDMDATQQIETRGKAAANAMMSSCREAKKKIGWTLHRSNLCAPSTFYSVRLSKRRFSNG